MPVSGFSSYFERTFLPTIVVVASFLSACTFNASIRNLGSASSSTSPGGGSSSSVLKTIYRSIGPENTSVLASGAANAMTMVSGTATFSTALAGRIGVGDAVVYNSNNSIAFVSGRTSSTIFVLKTATGDVPSDIAGDTSWSIYRAYTSALFALDGAENAAIPAGVANFDNWSGGRNLVTPNEQWNFALYGDAANTDSYIEFNGWTTSSSNYIRLYAPSLTSEVGISQRHSGVWDNTKARMISTGSDAPVVNSSHLKKDIRVEGLQIANLGTGNFDSAINITSGANSAEVYVIGNILRRYSNGGTSTVGVHTAVGLAGKMVIANNIVFGGWYRGIQADLDNSASGVRIVIYNNTVAGCVGFGIFGGSWTTATPTNSFSMKNNIVNRSTLDYNLDNGDFTSGVWMPSNNISSDATGPEVSLRNTDVIFMDQPNGDMRLSRADNAARDLGVDLSGDTYYAFSSDALEGTRTTWDIGATESSTIMPIYRSVGATGTSSLATGSSNNMTLSNGVATFANALPARVGVGDVFEYATSGNTIDAVVFIYKRVSSTKYLVRTSSGGIPPNRAAFPDWSLFRSYTTLANAIDSAVGANENNGLNGAVENFDTYASGRDMVATNEQWNFALYADGTDTMAVTVFPDGRANVTSLFTAPWWMAHTSPHR